MLLVFLYKDWNFNYFTLTMKMVQNSARLSGLPCALAGRWLSRVIRVPIRADMIKGELASGPASWVLGLSWHGRLHQLEISLQRTANSHGMLDNGHGLPSSRCALVTVSQCPRRGGNEFIGHLWCQWCEPVYELYCDWLRTMMNWWPCFYWWSFAD